MYKHCYDVIIKTLIAAEGPIVEEMNKVGNRQKCCFEVFGFDIMFDEALKPWVLEVNCLPSLSSSSIFDKQVKTQLICDAFTLVGFQGYNKKVMRKKRNDNLDEARVEAHEPYYRTNYSIEQLEMFGGVIKTNPKEESESMMQVMNDLRLPISEETYNAVMPSNHKRPGFPKNSILTKDELNVVLDLVEEKERCGEF